MTSYRNIRIWIAFPNTSEVIFDINALKRSKAAEFVGLPAEIFIAAPAVSADLLFPFIGKSKVWILMTLGIAKKTKTTLERIKERLERWFLF